MDKNTAIAITLGMGALLLLVASNAGASVNWSGDSSTPDSGPLLPDSVPNSTPDQSPQVQIMSVDNLSAFLAMIRQFESQGDYSVLYGGTHFSDFSKHPNIRIPINLPGYEGKVSTAAGAYQINYPTYKQFAPTLGITDFSPDSQDRIAVAILEHDGAMSRINTGDITGALRVASSRWASLPGSAAGQHPVSLATALDYFNSMVA